MSSLVRTVLGDISSESLGQTLIHEHLIVDWGEMLGRPKVRGRTYEGMLDSLVDRMQLLAETGFGTLVDCTPIGCGRYVDMLKDVARLGRINIIASTGFFHESWCPMHPIAQALELDAMVELFVREITEGMGSTWIKAGVIKCATGEGRITEKEEQVLRAAARAHLSTGCPIITHTTNGMGLEQLDIFEAEGVAPEAIILSHIGFEESPMEYSARVLKRGAFVCFDRIGMQAFFDDEHWVSLVRTAIRKGYLNQIMLSHDAAVYAHGPDDTLDNPALGDFTYIPRVFLPKLKREAGVTDEHLRTILEDNPRRALQLR